ncbi:MAG: hypothetical protein HYV51_00415 [Parcubacteria group bacterium]|nr:hypothetical protein [Parcubacteria group bacterium]
MSYKSKKIKKNRFNQLKYRFGLVKTALLKKLEVLLPQLSQKEEMMRLPQTVAIMEFLRTRNKTLRPNNQKINEWIDNYINDSILNGKSVDILTQWCMSKDLEIRYRTRDNQFIPLKTELELVQKEIPNIIQAFLKNGVAVNWWITFNNSFLDRGRIADDISDKYIEMIKNISQLENILFINWEKEILGERAKPNTEVLNNLFSFVSRKAFEIDFENLLERVKKYPDFDKTEDELRKEVQFKIACEAEEGRFLFSSDSPWPEGRFILIPLEFPERYVFFSTSVPDFKTRVMSVLKPYPWRLDSDNLKYEI